ncbi:MAG: hypothetical protein PHI98_16020 [Eubacteriales bacterium]|nr:hypothetical protein [Eubacteriales bacterium]
MGQRLSDGLASNPAFQPDQTASHADMESSPLRYDNLLPLAEAFDEENPEADDTADAFAAYHAKSGAGIRDRLWWYQLSTETLKRSYANE